MMTKLFKEKDFPMPVKLQFTLRKLDTALAIYWYLTSFSPFQKESHGIILIEIQIYVSRFSWKSGGFRQH